MCTVLNVLVLAYIYLQLTIVSLQYLSKHAVPGLA